MWIIVFIVLFCATTISTTGTTQWIQSNTTAAHTPSNNPSIVPTYLYSTATTAFCETECNDEALHSMQIKVVFWFEEYVTYDLIEITCFIHQIVVEWLVYEVPRPFEPCDIRIVDIRGGNDHVHSNTFKRRLLRFDGNTTMTFIPSNTKTGRLSTCFLRIW
eukprot:682795_1